MRLYSFRSVYMVIVGAVLMHLLAFCLCIFFINKFLINDYDPTVYLLLAMFAAMLIYFDVALCQIQAYHRCFYKFRMDSSGIECYDCFGVQIKMKWDEIRTCGVTGYDYLTTHHTFIYFSKIPNEPNTAKQRTTISKQRIVLEVRDESVAYLKSKLPAEFHKRIIPSLEKQVDCIYRR